MILDYLLVSLSWLGLLIYWLVSSFEIIHVRPANTHKVGIRVLVILFIALIFRGKIFGSSSHYYTFAKTHQILPTIGVILCIVGILFAVRARMQWVKENPKLSTKGIYQYVRHPIYTGLLLALIGSSIVGGLPWLLITCAGAFYFVYSANIEEKIMLKEFPKEYPAYQKKTKMFVPFVF